LHAGGLFYVVAAYEPFAAIDYSRSRSRSNADLTALASGLLPLTQIFPEISPTIRLKEDRRQVGRQCRGPPGVYLVLIDAPRFLEDPMRRATGPDVARIDVPDCPLLDHATGILINDSNPDPPCPSPLSE
jgi:hypothetical protein